MQLLYGNTCYNYVGFSIQGRDIDSEEIDETEEEDHIKFRDQLQSVGVLGRQVRYLFSFIKFVLLV